MTRVSAPNDGASNHWVCEMWHLGGSERVGGSATGECRWRKPRQRPQNAARLRGGGGSLMGRSRSQPLHPTPKRCNTRSPPRNAKDMDRYRSTHYLRRFFHNKCHMHWARGRRCAYQALEGETHPPSGPTVLALGKLLTRRPLAGSTQTPSPAPQQILVNAAGPAAAMP